MALLKAAEFLNNLSKVYLKNRDPSELRQKILEAKKIGETYKKWLRGQMRVDHPFHIVDWQVEKKIMELKRNCYWDF